jgi:exopolyphosphatase/guanosine-5'-triphosphate,3'-diphosphate pyrophosphatase
VAPTFGAIDAGSNALRVIIAKPTDKGGLNVLHAERAAVRLGHRTFTEGELDGDAIDAAVEAFGRFRELFTRHGVEHYRAVATSAVRNAANREDLLDRVHREAGLQLEVIDGEEEARLVRRAALRALEEPLQPPTIADLGGGSLELSARGVDGWLATSMRLGTVRLLETFGLTSSIGPDEATLVRRFVAATLRTSGALALPLTGEVAAVCGGNAEALAELFGTPAKDGAVGVLEIAALERALPELLALDVPGRMRRYKVRADRADVLAIAALILAEVARQLGLVRYLVPGVGLRDGLLLDQIDADGDLPAPRERVVLAGVRAFAARVGHKSTHAEQVRRLARRLFDELQPLHGMPGRARLVLEVAALLHDLGEVVHRRSHHKHGEYMILNGRFPGLDDTDRAMVGALVRAHRKSLPDEQRHATYAGLPENRRAQVRQLVQLLRLADALDRDRRHAVRELRVETGGKKVRVFCDLLPGVDAAPPDLGKAAGFAEAFERKLVVELVPAT